LKYFLIRREIGSDGDVPSTFITRPGGAYRISRELPNCFRKRRDHTIVSCIGSTGGEKGGGENGGAACFHPRL